MSTADLLPAADRKAEDLLLPDPDPASSEAEAAAASSEQAKNEEAASDNDDDDMDLEALRAAALSSIKPKKPQVRPVSNRTNLLEIVPANAGKETDPTAVNPPSRRGGGPRAPLHPRGGRGGYRPPRGIPVVMPPARFDRPPPGFPYLPQPQPALNNLPPPPPVALLPPVPAAVTGSTAPLLNFPPPLPQYYGVLPASSRRRSRSRSPYGRTIWGRSPPPSGRRYSRSPSPLPPRRTRSPPPYHRPPRRNYAESFSGSSSGSEEEVEEEVEVTATESEPEESNTESTPVTSKQPAAAEEAKETTEEAAKEQNGKKSKVEETPEQEPDDVLNVHAEADEFSSLLDTSETEKAKEAKAEESPVVATSQTPVKKKKTKIVKRIVKRKKKKDHHRAKQRPLSPVRKGGRSSPFGGRRPPRPRGRSRSPVRHRPRSPRRRRSQSPAAAADDKKADSKTEAKPVDKSKSLPPAKRRSASKEGKEEKKKETAEEKEEREFQERLAKTKSQDERDKMIARRKKFQSDQPVSAAESKVISLKTQARENSSKQDLDKSLDRQESELSEAVELGIEDTLDMFDEEQEQEEETDDRNGQDRLSAHENKTKEKNKGSVTDLRVQLHRKRMLRGDSSPVNRDRSPVRGGRRGGRVSPPQQRRSPEQIPDPRDVDQRGRRIGERPDPRDVDERRQDSAIGRMVVRAGLKQPMDRLDGRQIVVSRTVQSASASSDSDNDDIPIIKRAKRTNVMSRLGEPVHNVAAATVPVPVKAKISELQQQLSDRSDSEFDDEDEYLNATRGRRRTGSGSGQGGGYSSGGGGAVGDGSSPKKAKKTKKEKKVKKEKKDKRERKLEKKLKKLKEQLNTALKDDLDRPDKIDRLLSSNALADLSGVLADPPPPAPAGAGAKPAAAKKKASSKKRESSENQDSGNKAAVPPDDSEEALFRFFESEAS